ncbi:hypothetical protein GCM10009743_09680 [Kribbella swartbergensis]
MLREQRLRLLPHDPDELVPGARLEAIRADLQNHGVKLVVRPDTFRFHTSEVDHVVRTMRSRRPKARRLGAGRSVMP